MKKFCSLKCIQRIKRQAKTGIKYLSIMHLIKELYPVYIYISICKLSNAVVFKIKFNNVQRFKDILPKINGRQIKHIKSFSTSLIIRKIKTTAYLLERPK